MKELFYEKKDKIISIAIISFLVIIVIVILMLLIDNSSEERFYLIGNTNILSLQNVDYKDPGFVAKDKKGNNRNNEVIISGNVNTNICGDYEINYIWREKKLTRKVIVYCQNEFRLIGEEKIYILVNGKYQDEGFVAYYQNRDYSEKVTVKNNINYKVPGVYYIDYSISELNKKISRTIYVIDADDYFEVEYSKAKSRELTLNVTYDPNYIAYYLNPTDDRVSINSSTYKITKNGTYKFTIYDKYNNSVVKSIVINNIDDVKLSASCEARISLTKTDVTVNANRKVTKYVYNNNSSTSNTYTFNSKVENVNVSLYDEYNDSINIVCNKVYGSANMEVHFINSSQCDDAILIRTDDKTILIDSGSVYTKKAVLNYLSAVGVKKIDAMIGSHMHSDHIQTQGFVMQNYQVDKIYYPDDIFTCASRGSCVVKDQKYILDEIKQQNKTPIILKAGDKVEIGEITLYVIAPWNIRTSANSQNINSLIFILKFGDTTFMFTGDTPKTILEDENLNKYANTLGISLKVDVFKWSHHGTTPISTNVANMFSPKYVIVPNYDGYGKPTKSMAKPFTDLGAKIYEQNTYGNVLFISDGSSINVVTRTNPIDYKR